MIQSTIQIAARKFRKATEIFRGHGLNGIFQHTMRRAGLRNRVRGYRKIQDLVRGKAGLEIGGPSRIIFSGKGMVPLYPVLGKLDNCNYSDQTVWEGALHEGRHFRYEEGKEPGWQFIAEAAELKAIPSSSYQFLLSSHAIEHCANPLRVLEEWLRVLEDGGIMVLVVPHRDGTFDRLRPITTLDHLIEDHRRGVGEDDLTHVEEVVAYHVKAADDTSSTEEFRTILRDNHRHRKMHHHVFTTPSVVAMLDHVGLQLLFVEAEEPCNIVAVGRKLPAGQVADNRGFFGDHAAYRSRSPFLSDKV